MNACHDILGNLSDTSDHTAKQSASYFINFPAAEHKYPLLAKAPHNLLEKVKLRLHGLALRWEELDEDIWVEDAVCGRFPRPQVLAA